MATQKATPRGVRAEIETLRTIADQNHLTLEDVNWARGAHERCQRAASGPLTWNPEVLREAKALWDAIAARFTAA